MAAAAAVRKKKMQANAKSKSNHTPRTTQGNEH
jgi:hypothetical protein